MKIESSRITELDGLRGIAIGSVLIFHLNLLAPTNVPWLNRIMLFGWSGVDLFFILSGFLIGGILIDNRDSANYFSAFYARRFCRIVPLYFLIVALYYVFYLFGGQLRADLVHAVGPPMPWYSYLTFTNNIWIARHNYMEAFASPTWSLAIEEQFYLTLPLLVRLVKPRHLPALVVALIAGIAGFRMIMCLGHHVTPIQGYVLPWFRADALMIGVACAIVLRSDAIVAFILRRSWVLYIALAAFGAIIISTGGNLRPDTADSINTYGFTVVALFYATLLLIAILLPQHPLGRLFRLRPLRSLGKLAYCVYLLHVSVLLAAFSVLNDTSLAHNTFARWAVGVAAICVVLLVATISWNLLESRMICIGHRFKYARSNVQPTPRDVLPLVG